jgi:hypothetical protein
LGELQQTYRIGKSIELAQKYQADDFMVMAAGADKYLANPVKLCERHHTIQECLDLN